MPLFRDSVDRTVTGDIPLARPKLVYVENAMTTPEITKAETAISRPRVGRGERFGQPINVTVVSDEVIITPDGTYTEEQEFINTGTGVLEEKEGAPLAEITPAPEHVNIEAQVAETAVETSIQEHQHPESVFEETAPVEAAANVEPASTFQHTEQEVPQESLPEAGCETWQDTAIIEDREVTVWYHFNGTGADVL